MADGDVIRTGIPGRYQPAYRELCANSGSPEHWGQLTARGVKESVKRYGDAPRQLMSQIALLLQAHAHTTMPVPASLGLQMEYKISQLQRCLPDNYGVRLMTDACRRVFYDLTQGKRFPDMTIAVAERYITRIYQATFVARVDDVPANQHPISRSILRARMGQLDDAMESHLKHLAREFCQKGTQQMRLLRVSRHHRPIVSLDTEMD